MWVYIYDKVSGHLIPVLFTSCDKYKIATNVHKYNYKTKAFKGHRNCTIIGGGFCFLSYIYHTLKALFRDNWHHIYGHYPTIYWGSGLLSWYRFLAFNTTVPIVTDVKLCNAWRSIMQYYTHVIDLPTYEDSKSPLTYGRYTIRGKESQLFIFSIYGDKIHTFWVWRYLTRELIWHLSQSSIRSSIYFSSIVKSRPNPFLEPTGTKQ